MSSKKLHVLAVLAILLFSFLIPFIAYSQPADEFKQGLGIQNTETLLQQPRGQWTIVLVKPFTVWNNALKPSSVYVVEAKNYLLQSGGVSIAVTPMARELGTELVIPFTNIVVMIKNH